MQDFWENDRHSAILNFISAKFFMVVLCESLHFVLYAWCSYFALFFEASKYHKITQIQNGH